VIALTGAGVITAALERLGAKDRTAELSSEDSTQALPILRRMIGLWNTRSLLPRVRQRSTFTITASDGEYTIGDATHTPDFTGDRLRFLESAALIVDGQTREQPLSILTPQRYQGEPDKALESTPTAIYIEPTVPTATITLIPVPQASGTLVLYYKPLLPTFADLTTEYYFDDGYEAAIVSNLATWCAGPFRINVNEDPTLLVEAADTRRAIESLNEGPEEMVADPTGVFEDSDAGWRIETGE
jgi:hypothetical protein